MNTLTGEILTLPKIRGSVSTANNLSGNVGAKTINIGEKGDDGATFVPSVSADGVISWTNDKDLPNPEPVNIKGAKGDKGEQGERGLQGPIGATGPVGPQGIPGQNGEKGDKGDTGPSGARGMDGRDGADGRDGVSATHEWVGTTLKITSASGTTSADLKGDPGQNGSDGRTPQRGVDYWTDADKSEIVQSVKDNISVPTKTSQLQNDSGFLTQHQKLKTINGQSIVGSGNIEIQGGSGGSNPHAEVITPTKLLKAQSEQYCKSYYMYDFEDIKNVRVICKQSFNGSAINHYRTGDIQYVSAVCLYKDANNFLSILFNGYKLAVRNKKAGTVLNEVELGQFNYGTDSLNTSSGTCWCAEIDLQNKVTRFLRMLNGELVTYTSDNGTVDISEWDLSHLDSFNIVFGCSEYQSDSFCYYCSINDRLRIADYLTQPIEYAKHNCFNTYVANTVKPLTVIASRGQLAESNAIVGTLIDEWDNIHKKYSFVGDSSYRYVGLGCTTTGTNHKGQIFVARLKFTDMSDDFKITYGIGSLAAWVADEQANTFNYGTAGQYWHPEDGVVYDFVTSYGDSIAQAQYMYKAIGSFTVEILDMYYMTPQSANICGETYDGTYFRGTMPFAGINVKFNNDYSRINTSMTGLGIPKYYNYTDSDGNVHIYNGSAWKKIT